MKKISTELEVLDEVDEDPVQPMTASKKKDSEILFGPEVKSNV